MPLFTVAKRVRSIDVTSSLKLPPISSFSRSMPRSPLCENQIACIFLVTRIYCAGRALLAELERRLPLWWAGMRLERTYVAVELACAIRKRRPSSSVPLVQSTFPAGSPFAGSCRARGAIVSLRSLVRSGSNSEVESRSRRVCFTPMNGHRQTGPTGPFRARSRRHALTLHVSSYHSIHRTISPL
jgi:hypothetical protein